MDGVELFNSIKSNPGFSEIPFILLTSVREKGKVPLSVEIEQRLTPL